MLPHVSGFPSVLKLNNIPSYVGASFCLPIHVLWTLGWLPFCYRECVFLNCMNKWIKCTKEEITKFMFGYTKVSRGPTIAVNK